MMMDEKVYTDPGIHREKKQMFLMLLLETPLLIWKLKYDTSYLSTNFLSKQVKLGVCGNS
jgi:hypothetical protein